MPRAHTHPPIVLIRVRNVQAAEPSALNAETLGDLGLEV